MKHLRLPDQYQPTGLSKEQTPVAIVLRHPPCAAARIALEEPEHKLSGKDGEAGEGEENVGEDAQCLVVGVRLPCVVEDDAKVGEVVAKADSLGWIGLFSGKSTASGRPSVLSEVPPNTSSLIHRILDIVVFDCNSNKARGVRCVERSIVNCQADQIVT